MDLTTELDRLTLNVAAQILLGEEAIEDGRIRRLVDELVREFTPRAMAISQIWPSWLPSPQSRRLKRLRRHFEKLAGEIIAHGKRRGFSKKNLVGILAQALLSDEEPSPHAFREVTDQIITLLLAGHETVATTLGWTYALLAQNPDVEARFLAEVDAVCGGKKPTVDQLARLSYTDMIIKESMRIYPAAWAINRVALADYEVGGFTIPKGSNVSVNAFVTHRDPRIYKDPLTFDPLRWTPEEEAKRPDLCYFPFGAGARGCIGGGFAMMEMKMILAVVAQSWRLKLEPNQDFSFAPHITLRPRKNVRVRLVARTDVTSSGRPSEARAASAHPASPL